MVAIKAYLHPLLHLLIKAFLSRLRMLHKDVKPMFYRDIRLFLIPLQEAPFKRLPIYFKLVTS